jgi:hypothetical protein
LSYNPFNLSSAQGATNSIERSGAPVIWTYSTFDGASEILSSGYIKDDSDNAISQYIKVGDIVNVNYGDNNSFTMVTRVISIAPIKLSPYYPAQTSLYSVGIYSTGGGAETETFNILPGGGSLPYFTTVIASLNDNGPNNVQLISAKTINNAQILLTFTANPGIGTLINYAIFIGQV